MQRLFVELDLERAVVAAAVIAAGGLIYPVVSTALHSQSRTSAVAVHAADLTTAGPGNAIPVHSSATTVSGATTPATVAAKTVTAPRKSPTPKSSVTPKRAAGSGTAQAKTGSTSAGASLALRVTGSPAEAARFGNLVASITIMKKGTGTASPEEVLAADAAWPV